MFFSNNKNQNPIPQQIQTDTKNTDWFIQIPSINLIAPIAETTNMDILDEYVGHFEETPSTEGNIGLAGHNRGYKNNFFEKVGTLNIGDEIFYKKNEFESLYIIDTIEIIKSTNWSYLENTNQNKITLITCVENKPDLRLCIQATEK